MRSSLKFRQPIFDNGKFKEFHYWGVSILQAGELANIGWLSYKMGITDPKDSQQFTGVRDMNDTEIYLGDINQDGGTVIWNADDASFVWEYKENEVMAFEEEGTWCQIIGHNFKTLK